MALFWLLAACECIPVNCETGYSIEVRLPETAVFPITVDAGPDYICTITEEDTECGSVTVTGVQVRFGGLSGPIDLVVTDAEGVLFEDVDLEPNVQKVFPQGRQCPTICELSTLEIDARE